MFPGRWSFVISEKKLNNEIKQVIIFSFSVSIFIVRYLVIANDVAFLTVMPNDVLIYGGGMQALPTAVLSGQELERTHGSKVTHDCDLILQNQWTPGAGH